MWNCLPDLVMFEFVWRKPRNGSILNDADDRAAFKITFLLLCGWGGAKGKGSLLQQCDVYILLLGLVFDIRSSP